MNSWGKLAAFNCARCNPYTIRCARTIQEFSRVLVSQIDMVAYGKPIIEHFGSGNKAGFTLLQLIETSNITAHFVEETNDIYVDIFSCKDFDEKEAEKVIMNFFQPHNIDTVVIPRQAKEKMC